MPLVLYGVALSPPCRNVLIVAEALGIPLEIKTIDLAKGENTNPEFVKINPLHTIPTLDDDGTILEESHAIMAYLVSKYGKDDSLYPKDFTKRALVDAKLHFDTGYAFSILRRSFRAHVYHGQKEALTDLQTQLIEEVYGFVNTFLEGKKWLIGDSITIADIALVSSLTSLDAMVPLNDKRFPNVQRWINDAETLPYFKLNKQGVEEYREVWKAVIAG